ncbi:MAG: heme exporter protein CcmD [Parvibaculaceae bacterium]|nr:heme exporter protein CcmD [Parvibaculaceae bacterium]|tara:strand:- start:229 stop:405 length:177 start_codon:yes stop_codon:yes gene_type:complete
MDSWTEFFNMGGYGPYIWSSFLIAIAVMTGLALQSWMDLKKQKRLVSELEARAERKRS